MSAVNYDEETKKKTVVVVMVGEMLFDCFGNILEGYKVPDQNFWEYQKYCENLKISSTLQPRIKSDHPNPEQNFMFLSCLSFINGRVKTATV